MSTWRERITNNRYFYHYLFWVIVLLSYFVDAAELRHFNGHLFLYTLVLKNGLLIAIVYLHLRVLVPAFLDSKKYWLYSLSLVITILCGTWLTNRVEKKSWKQVYTDMHKSPLKEETSEVTLEVTVNPYFGHVPSSRYLLDALTVCRYLVISILLKFIDDFFRQREELQHVQQEKTMAELNVLKAQINPHFLFNTLNNLYGLVLERSDHAAESVLKLADIMKYTLSEGDAPTVPLKKDLENLRNYFELEKLRLTDTAEVIFVQTGAIENQRITPLLLLPLLENAFKHGVHRSRAKPVLKVDISVEGDVLELKTWNPKPAPDQAAPSLGMGLQNVRKRLDLLYPKRYQLEIVEDESYFRLTLRLQLK